MTQPGQPASPGPGSGPDATPKVVSGSDQAANEAVSRGKRTPSAGQAPPDTPDPTGTAAQPPQSPAVDAQPDADGEQPPEDLSAQAMELENKLAEVRARAAGQETVQLRVEEPHAALIHGGITIGTEWTDVPAHAVPAIMEGAANSGVTLTQNENEES